MLPLLLPLQAFGPDGIITLGDDHAEVDWQALWRARLAESTGGQQGAEGYGGMGWSSKMTMEAYVVNLVDAAGKDDSAHS